MTNLAAYGQSVVVSRHQHHWIPFAHLLFSLSESFFMVKGAALFLQQGGSTQGPKTPTHHKHAGGNRVTQKHTKFFLFYLCSLHKQDPRQKQMCICRVFSPCLWVLFVFSLKHHIIRSDPKSPAVQRQAYIDCFIQEHSEGTTPP